MLGMTETGSVYLESEDESEAYFPGAIHIVDLYHVREYLAAVGRLAFGSGA